MPFIYLPNASFISSGKSSAFPELAGKASSYKFLKILAYNNLCACMGQLLVYLCPEIGSVAFPQEDFLS